MEEPPARVEMTRSPSADSSSLSNIEVAGSHGDDFHAIASTPPTSISDARSIPEADGTPEKGRPRRSRAGPSTYNVNQLTTIASVKAPVPADEKRSRKRQREVEEEEDTTPRKAARTQAANRLLASAIGALPSARRQLDLTRALKSAGSYLGKTGRKMLAAGKKKIDGKASRLEKKAVNTKTSRILRQLDTGKGGLLDEIDLDASFPVPSFEPKKAGKSQAAPVETKLPAVPVGPLQKTSDGRRVKKWQETGLYVGQALDTDPARLSKKSSTTNPDGTAKKAPFMPLPMFKYLEQTRNFTIPFDVYAPSLRKGDEKPKDWHKINRNRLVGEAKELWEKGDRLPISVCVCPEPGPGEQGCDEDCLNRVMQYECNADNCCLPASQCSNRAFVHLSERIKKGGLYDIGVEVVKTPNRGFGVRAARSFSPGQIIMEYTGEIISEGECQRRIREDYKDKQCYYLMELERNLVIDGTKGSMARFINHSCDPNCEVRMVTVNGTPRMAVYAGDGGIMTGEELTYDYNFDNFGETRQNCYCGAHNCRGYLSKRLNATEQKKQAKLEEERRRVAAIEAQKVAEKEAKKKQIKNDRGSAWRGWVSVDDAEVKDQLRAEKRAREEAEMKSSRAMRLAARAAGPASPARSSKRGVQVEASRRRTMNDVPSQKKVLTPASGRKRRFAADDIDIEVKPSTATSDGASTKVTEKETPAPKNKHQRLSSSTSTIKVEKKPETEVATTSTTTTTSVTVKKTTLTLDVEEVEIREETTSSAQKGQPQNKPASSSIKMKQSTLNFAKIA